MIQSHPIGSTLACRFCIGAILHDDTGDISWADDVDSSSIIVLMTVEVYSKVIPSHSIGSTLVYRLCIGAFHQDDTGDISWADDADSSSSIMLITVEKSDPL